MVKRYKTLSLVLISIITLSSFAISMDYEKYGCDRRLASLERQAETALQLENASRVKMLERATQLAKEECGLIKAGVEGREIVNETTKMDAKDNHEASIAKDDPYIDYYIADLERRVLQLKENLIEIEYKIDEAKLTNNKNDLALHQLRYNKVKRQLELNEAELMKYR